MKTIFTAVKKKTIYQRKMYKDGFETLNWKSRSSVCPEKKRRARLNVEGGDVEHIINKY